jgi:hypothetical protein
MPRPSHSSRFDHPHNSGWRVQIMKLHIMKSSPLSWIQYAWKYYFRCFVAYFICRSFMRLAYFMAWNCEVYLAIRRLEGNSFNLTLKL